MFSRALVALSLLLLQVYTAYSIEGANVVITPPNDITVAITSTENITYECTVGPGFRPEWAVNSFQLRDLDDELVSGFAAAGIFIEVLNTSTTRLIVSQQWRTDNTATESQSTVNCDCTPVQQFSRGATSETFRVITYAQPAPVDNLQLVSRADELTLVWDPPSNAPPSVSTTYDVTILNITGETAVPYESSVTTEASLNIHDLELSLLDQPCQEFQFIVVPMNDAGVGRGSVYNETVPVSANTSAIDATRQLVFLELGEDGLVVLTLRFLTVESCSPNYPVLEYTVNLNSQPALSVPASQVTPDTLTDFTINSTELGFPVPHNSFHRLTVTVRSAVSQRTSGALVIHTTDVQSSEVTFYQTNVLLRCVFANVTRSRGCLFRFSPNLNGTGQQEFFLPKGIMITETLCNSTMNQASAYTDSRISVFNIGEGGDVSNFNIDPTVREIMDRENFTLATGCPVEGPPQPTFNLAAAIAVPLVIILIGVFVTVILFYCMFYKKVKGIEIEKNILEQKYNEEVDKPKRRPSLIRQAEGIYGVNVDPGDLLHVLDDTDVKKPLTPSASSGSSIASEPAPRIPVSSSADQLDVPTVEITGSTGSYSPPKQKRPSVDRSLSEGAEPFHSIDSGKGVVQLFVSRNSMDIKVRREQLLEELQRRRKEQKAKASKHKTSRSRSVSNDSNLSKEETTPLLGVTLSEIQFSKELLHAISEEHLEPLGEDSNEYTGLAFNNPITPFPIGSDSSMTGDESKDTVELVPNGQGSSVELHNTAGESTV